MMPTGWEYVWPLISPMDSVILDDEDGGMGSAGGGGRVGGVSVRDGQMEMRQVDNVSNSPVCTSSLWWAVMSADSTGMGA